MSKFSKTYLKNTEENKFNVYYLYYNRDTTYILEKKNIKIIKYNNKSKLMKHLIETADSSSLATVPYDRIVLDSTENDVIVKGGV